MAGTPWGTFFDIEENLLHKGHQYSFFQAVRLIRLILRRQEQNGIKDAASIEGPFLRVRPKLTLGFPSADIADIQELPLDDHQRRFLLDVTFLGLYGTSSPLPSFYTEDLLNEASDDKSVTRDFLDVLNTVIYQLFIRSLLKYNLFLQVSEEHDNRYLERLYCLAGLGESLPPDASAEEKSLFRYSGIMNQSPRSALGLRTILRDALGQKVTIEQCVTRMVVIPEDQRAVLGLANMVLGEDLHLGSEIADCMQLFRIIIGPVNANQTADYLPGGTMYRRADFLTNRYLNMPLDYELKILISSGGIQPVCLGDRQCACLGVNSWFIADNNEECITASFTAGRAGINHEQYPRRISC
jgi:type VI secretion system protein ImpH